LQQYGFCEESTWPYTRKLYKKPPSERAYKEAAHHSIVPLKVPINIDSVRTCLNHGIPVLVGIILSSDDAYHNRGWIKIPKKPPKEPFHACLVVGYDDRTQYFTIRNSWGRDWVC
jgi:C1A family cysteine protease